MSIFFIYSEKRLAKFPLMPLDIFKESSNIASVALGFFHGLVSQKVAKSFKVKLRYELDLHRNRILRSSLFPIRHGCLATPIWRSHPPTYSDGVTGGTSRWRRDSSHRPLS
jgi:hypothetical protein